MMVCDTESRADSPAVYMMVYKGVLVCMIGTEYDSV
jgi:hypothetical protein